VVLGGNDTIQGLLGDDQLLGGNGNDKLFGSDGNDRLVGGAGNDLLDGGDGAFDLADYSSAASRVVVDLSLTAAQDTQGAGTDTLVDIEQLLGSQFNDALLGDSVNNVFNGLNGNDSLTGRDGSDRLLGQGGNDKMFGNKNGDAFDGGPGDDTINGGNGFDVAEYFGAEGPVTVDLAITIAQNTGGAGIDLLVSIEAVSGSNESDTLLGNSLGNSMNGQGGNDNMAGRDGNDNIIGNAGIDTMDGGAGDDELVGVENRDVLIGGTGADKFRYISAGDSNGVTGRDKVQDFSHAEGDKIDLAIITNGGAPFLGGKAFTENALEVRVTGQLDKQFVSVDVDGDGATDLSIVVASATRLVESDFLL
jgi:Ca2+-binding RTX toxin-like protein